MWFHVFALEEEAGESSKDEVRKALKRIKNAKAISPDDIMVEVWKCRTENSGVFDEAVQQDLGKREKI